MSKISVLKVVQLKWFLFTSRFLWHTFRSSILKIAKTDTRNIKYTLELSIDITGNICKKMTWKAWNLKITEIKKDIENNKWLP